MLPNDLSVWEMQNKNSTEAVEAQHADSDQGQQLQQSEQSLAEQLKTFCDENGREKKPQKSAKVIQQLGRVYRQRSPEKISLIRSAILFNGALVRKPDNVGEVEADLRELCAHVLQLADADDKSADLMSQASLIHRTVLEMREVVGEVLKTLLPIPGNVFGDAYLDLVDNKTKDVIQIQEYISLCYKNAMKHIMRFCIQTKGTPPCQYSLAGMGSLARKEITPFSDFESVIVLEEGIQLKSNYEEILEYFRWVAVMFQLVLVGFQETVIYDAAIPSLSWFYDAFTPCGISPDGFYPHASHNPLGRQDLTQSKPWRTELIKPVSEMLKYLETEEDLKNGYHLADILTTTSYVCGAKEVYNMFQAGVEQRSQNQGFSFSSQTTTDLKRFGMWRSIQNMFWSDQFNVKLTIYRTVGLFVAALDQLCGHKSESPFDAIAHLDALLPAEFRRKLGYAVALACEMRLRTYMSLSGQEDQLRTGTHVAAEYRSNLAKLLGERSANDFMIIAFHLHGFIAKLVDELYPESTSVFNQGATIIQASTWGRNAFDTVFPRKLFILEYASHINNELLMMNSDRETLIALFHEDKLKEYYHLRATINVYLGHYVAALADFHQALSGKTPVPSHIKYFAWLTAKQIATTVFPDDMELKEQANDSMPNRMISVFGENIRQLVLDSRKEAPMLLDATDEEQEKVGEKKVKLKQSLVSLLSKLKTARTDFMENILTSFLNWKDKESLESASPVDVAQVLDTYTKILAKHTSNQDPAAQTVRAPQASATLSDEESKERQNQENRQFVELFHQLEDSLGCASINLEAADEGQIKQVKKLVSGFFHGMTGLANLSSGSTVNVESLRRDLAKEIKSPGFMKWFDSIGPQMIKSVSGEDKSKLQKDDVSMMEDELD